MALAALALASACGTLGAAPSGSDAPHLGGVVQAPRWSGEADVVADGPGRAFAVVPYPGSVESSGDANRRPLWLLYELDGRHALDRTPEGISTRGGLAVAVASPTTVWVGIGSYRGQLDGVVARSRDNGRDWSFGVVPALYDPAGNLAALSSEEVAVLAGSPREPALLVSIDAGASWDEAESARSLASALPAGCRPEGLSSLGSTLVIGTSCRASTEAVLLTVSAVHRRGEHWALRRAEVPLGRLDAVVGRRGGVVRVVPPAGNGPVFVEAAGPRTMAIAAASPAALLAEPSRSGAAAHEDATLAPVAWLSGLPTSCRPTFSPDAVVARCAHRTVALVVEPGARAETVTLPAGLGGAAPALAVLAGAPAPAAGAPVAVLAGAAESTPGCWETVATSGSTRLGPAGAPALSAWRAIVLPLPSTAASLGGGS